MKIYRFLFLITIYRIPSISSAISNKRHPPSFPSKQHLKNTTFENKRFLLNSNSKHLLSDRSDDNSRQHMWTVNEIDRFVVDMLIAKQFEEEMTRTERNVRWANERIIQ